MKRAKVVGRRQLGHRMRFAESFKTKDEVANALATYQSWRQIVSKASAS